MPPVFFEGNAVLSDQKNRIRTWPALLILGVDAVYTFGLWNFFGQAGRQYQVLGTMIGQIVALVLLILWLLYFSGAHKRVKVVTLAVLASGGIAFSAMYRFVALTGDLVPIFEPRWSGSTPELTQRLAPEEGESSALEAVQADYPQFRGPDRTAVLPGPKLATDWDVNPPQLIWKRPIGEGWSGFAVIGDFAVTQEQDGPDELVTCYSSLTGERIWRYVNGGRFETVVGGTGPRGTPTISENQVFAFGATGHLSSVALATGTRLWEKDLKSEPTVVIPEWGFSSSPLIVGNLVVVCAGGKAGNSLIGYHKDTGAREWTAGSDSAEYGSPQLAELAGTPQILNFSKSGIFAYSPEDGETLWSFPWPVQPRKVAQPLVLNSNQIVVSSGYGVGSKLLEIGPSREGRLSADLVWESNRLKAKFANFVHLDDYIYGLDDGILTCIDIAGGKRMWKRGRYGHGQLILVDDKLLISTEKGEIVLVDANPSAFAELCRFQAIEGKTWNTPALAGQYLFVRNSHEAACFQLPVKSEETVSLKVTTN